MLNDEDDFMYHLTKNISKREVSDLEKWIKADGGTLSEGIFLVHGKNPSDFLEHYKAYLEYPRQLYDYKLAERSIKSGTLKANKTQNGYWIIIDDILNWAIDKEIGEPEFIEKILTLRNNIKFVPQEELIVHKQCLIDSHLHNAQTSSNTTDYSKNKEENLSFPSIDQKSEKLEQLFKKVKEIRMQSIDLALQEKFSNENEKKSKCLHLIQDYGSTDKEKFLKHIKGPTPPFLFIKHRCQTIGLFLRFFEPKMKIYILENHDTMKKYGWREDKKSSPKTFRMWMNEANIYDQNRNR